MENPIRKKKAIHIKSPVPGGMGLVTPGFWYAICPKCGETIKHLGHPILYGKIYTRKQAKDALHRHLKKCKGTQEQ